MNRFVCLVTGVIVAGVCAATLTATDVPLDWAYAIGSSPANPSRAVARNVDRQQARDPFNVLDWTPESHPPMPIIVAHGRKPGVMACGYCHLANGYGRPDSANLAGLPVEYIVQQMTDYRNNQRKSANPRGQSSVMTTIARTVAEEDIQAAARYFASVAPRPWIRVVEVAQVPGASADQSIGDRVVELPEDAQRAALHDTSSGFIAYVPPGSLKRGEMLVTTGGGGRTVRCALCHGGELKGTATVPGIAGRSPSYLARQLNDMHQGSRFGSRPDRMMGTVARLNESDVVSIVAYAASLAP